MDGHEKIANKCAGEPPSKGGRPRKDGQIRHFNNGWFMLTPPDTDPLEKIVELYPNVNAVIYDRACSCMSAGQKMSSLHGIKVRAVDRFHSKGHVANCPCHTTVIPRLRKRMKGINTSIAEQSCGASNAKVLSSGIWAQAQQRGELQRLAALESVLYGEEASQGHSLFEEACRRGVPMQSESHEKAAFLSWFHEMPGIVIYFYGICAQTSCCKIRNDI